MTGKHGWVIAAGFLGSVMVRTLALKWKEVWVKILLNAE